MGKYRSRFLKKMVMVMMIVWIISMPVYAYSKLDSTLTQPNSEKAEQIKYVLYINSYHEGYKWSDDIKKTIEATFETAAIEIYMDIVYLDTQRISDTEPNDYYESLSIMFANRFKNRKIDLILTSDDAAYDFIKKYGDFLNPEIPIIFCGLNDLSKTEEDNKRLQSGIVEYMDIFDTIALIQSIHSNITKIYYIADSTLTGQLIEKNLIKQLSDLKNKVEAVKIEGRNLSEIINKVRQLDENSVILFSIYFYDEAGSYFEYDEGISLISEASNVPIYGLWEFTLGNGIVGGKLLSGIEQGKFVADKALEYFETGIFDAEIMSNNTNDYKFDYKQLLKFNIPLENLPEGSSIMNYSSQEKKNILILHSYNSGFKWTDNIDAGIRESLADFTGNYEIYTEYMDLKRKDDSIYLNEFKKLFIEKHEMRQFDLIFTSDDGAFVFAQKYLPSSYQTVPIVFCGINNYSVAKDKNRKTYTGVMEAYDLTGTINSLIKLQPEVKEIFVINDMTITGQANRVNLEKIIPDYEGQLKFVQVDNINMTDLLTEVSKLKSDTAILLLSINKDKANNSFSYSESIKLIYEASVVPIYSIWDFYLGDGIVGGYLTNAYLQGKLAGEMGARILNGVLPEDIDIIKDSPNDYMFDMDIIRKFNINEKNIPINAIIINGNPSFGDIYQTNKQLFSSILIIFIFSIVLISVLFYFLQDSVRKSKRIHKLATIDQLTGILNRGSGIKELIKIVENPKNYNEKLYISFLDINNLKFVNDHYGHVEGDRFILTIVDTIKGIILEKDIFCRMGGDEFMLVFMYEDHESIKKIESAIHEKLAKESIINLSHYDYSVSMGSYGFVIGENVDITKVIEAADAKMYENKLKYRESKRKIMDI